MTFDTINRSVLLSRFSNAFLYRNQKLVRFYKTLFVKYPIKYRHKQRCYIGKILVKVLLCSKIDIFCGPLRTEVFGRQPRLPPRHHCKQVINSSENTWTNDIGSHANATNQLS